MTRGGMKRITRGGRATDDTVSDTERSHKDVWHHEGGRDHNRRTGGEEGGEEEEEDKFATCSGGKRKGEREM